MIGVTVWFGSVEGALTDFHREECGMYVSQEIRPPNGVCVSVKPLPKGGGDLLVEADSPGLRPKDFFELLVQIDSLIGDWSLVYGRTQAQHARDLRLEAQR